jgi:glycosyltransferase involved in cell wall biosynthesis
MTSVVLVCERLDAAGGVERFCCGLANHLAGLGWRVALASTSPAGARPPYDLHPQVQLLHAPLALPPARGPLRRVALALRQWRIGRALAGLLRRTPADVLLLNGLTGAVSVLAAAPGLARRAVCCDHNHFDARSRPWRWARRWLYPRVAAVVSLTEADRARFAALNPCTEVIANASALQAHTPVAGTSPVVLAVGRHVAQKGLDLLLQAWAAVAAARPDARLQIVGDGPETAALQALATRLGLDASVVWLPATTGIEALYRAAALFVLPSRYEGMPLALLEAQALGLPAVAFDCPTGPREILGGQGGLLVPAGDVAGLASALIELLADPERRAQMGAAALSRSQAHFSPAQHFARWTALLQRVAAG